MDRAHLHSTANLGVMGLSPFFRRMGDQDRLSLDMVLHSSLIPCHGIQYSLFGGTEMGYKDKAAAARSQNAARNIEPVFVKIESEGQEIVGRYLSRIEVKGKEKMGNVFYYTFDTDNGAVKTRFGQAFDNTTGAMLKTGAIYSITYKGKKDIGHNQTVRVYEALEIPEDVAEEPTPGGDENPL